MAVSLQVLPLGGQLRQVLVREYFSISPGCFSPSFSSPDWWNCLGTRQREAQSESQALSLRRPRQGPGLYAGLGPVRNHRPLENSVALGVFQGQPHPHPSSEHTDLERPDRCPHYGALPLPKQEALSHPHGRLHAES